MGSMNTVTDMMGLGYLDDGQTEAYLKDMGMTGPGVYLGDGQMEAYLKDTVMTGLRSAWTMARWRTKEYRRKI